MDVTFVKDFVLNAYLDHFLEIVSTLLNQYHYERCPLLCEAIQCAIHDSGDDKEKSGDTKNTFPFECDRVWKMFIVGKVVKVSR